MNCIDSISVNIDADAVEEIKMKAIECAWKTMEALHTDLVQSQTMPFRSGTLQNRATHVEKTENGAEMTTDTPYAKRVYFHPEYRFFKKENPNAQAYWLETYIDGSKKDFAQETFEKFVKEVI